MILGVHSFVWGDVFDEQLFWAVDSAARLGYDGFEAVLSAQDFDVKALKRKLDGHGMKASLSCTMDAARSIASSDAETREKGRAFYKHCFEVAETLEATNFVGPLFVSGKPPKARSGAERDEEWRRVAGELCAVADAAKHHGVTVCIEPVHRYKSDLINTAEQAMKMIDEVGAGNLKILFDTYHANIEEKSITGTISAMGARYLGEMHLCDNDKGAPGTAHIDFEAVAESLAEIGFDGFAVFESFVPFNRDNLWRCLAPTQDLLAQDALRAMRGLFPA